ncbi:alpha-glucuronidase [Flavobacterium sp. Sd200]|uniref:alpha-glucuronidase family glycosyl hydrolase n=1 Tax=Flavobacterium sp. Sd200 TaxID=2692211 RepID=UPI001370FD39|nr:alpha-glucuronidase family glycosyl hydrolase [Flavobacterium sp. Sd200]MXN93201.1 alpha-glucuronidase [Flavobacterium sp. Sd200]
MNYYKILFAYLLVFILPLSLKADDGYRLWLKYDKINNATLLNSYSTAYKSYYIEGNPANAAVIQKELSMAFKGLLGKDIKQGKAVSDGCIVIGTPASSTIIKGLKIDKELAKLGDEGFLIKTVVINKKKCTVITANKDNGLLYGVFHFLRLIQTQQNTDELNIESAPKLQVRLLNHWDNLDGSVERGYAGTSIWNWDALPATLDPKYTDYARANASVGINGTVLNNVNSNPKIMTADYLPKVKALADVFRPYGLKVYLSVSFSAPIKIGGLKTADPLDPAVIEWWKNKTDEIYKYIPDFGGFLVKANSEGQPGPQDYGRTHADGANMLADVLKPHNGIVMWRAFVYNSNPAEDRTLQAYNSFKPFDGKFKDNVLVQIKNGAIDFQPREPFSPLFGAMPNTSLMMEFQITQEYLGSSKHLVYLASLFEETLQSDTYTKGKGSTVSNVLQGKYTTGKLTGMAGVSNIGNSVNWTGHPFGQANWFSMGRLAWDPDLTAESIADEWIKMTFPNVKNAVDAIKTIMMQSREAAVNYMTPLGLHHIMAYNTHQGPGPWVDTAAQPNWKSTYYHNADANGIGFNRTSTGSDAVGQYFPPVRDMFEKTETCPENLLLWFHHLKWTYKMKSGKSLWDELCQHYYKGVDEVRTMQKTWETTKGSVDAEIFTKVKDLLATQEKEAVIWRNGCVLYFQTFSKMPVPAGLETPDKPLSYYKELKVD